MLAEPPGSDFLKTYARAMMNEDEVQRGYEVALQHPSPDIEFA